MKKIIVLSILLFLSFNSFATKVEFLASGDTFTCIGTKSLVKCFGNNDYGIVQSIAFNNLKKLTAGAGHA